MRSVRALFVVVALSAALPLRAQDAAPAAPQPPLVAADPAAPPQPQSPPPAAPAPEAQPQPPQAQQAPTPSGQWVYTQQYGWVWMPYGTAYTYVTPDYATPYQFVFQVGIGWSWVAAPWVYGYGPWPYFGFAGPYAFAWYGWGYWHYPYYGYGHPGYGYPGYGRPVPPYRPGVPYPARSAGGGYMPGVAAPHAGVTAGAAPHGGGGFVPHGRH